MPAHGAVPNGGHAAAAALPVPACPVCSGAGWRSTALPLQHHSRVHTNPSPRVYPVLYRLDSIVLTLGAQPYVEGAVAFQLALLYTLQADGNRAEFD